MDQQKYGHELTDIHKEKREREGRKAKQEKHRKRGDIDW